MFLAQLPDRLGAHTRLEMSDETCIGRTHKSLEMSGDVGDEKLKKEARGCGGSKRCEHERKQIVKPARVMYIYMSASVSTLRGGNDVWPLST